MSQCSLKIALAMTLLLSLTACEEGGMAGARKHFAERENQALAESFEGVRTSKGKQENLYTIEQTGVSTAAIVDAANGFVGALNDAQKAQVLFAVDSDQWRRWSNVDNGIYARQGMSLKAMTGVQQQKLFALLDASLSVRGMEQVRNIMKSEHTLKELNDNAPHLDEQLYFITLMGEPSGIKPWGWQFEGHHIAINYFVLGSQVVMTPVFMGAEPVMAESGKYKGNVVLQQEQDQGLTFMRGLTDSQKQQATLGGKHKSDMVAAANQDNLVLDYQGLPARALNDAKKQQLLDLIEVYVGKMREGHAKAKMAEVRAHLDDTWFAWAGETSEDAVFYYRIHSPVVLIEFDHQRPVAIEGPDRAIRNHIHTMVRTPNGNDYGKDLLRLHLEQHHQH